MKRFSVLMEGEPGAAGGSAAPPVVAPPAATPPAGAAPPADVPWSEYASKHAEPAKLEPYKNAKTWAEVHDLQEKRLADAQTALRTRQQQPGLPPRPPADAPPEAHTAWRAAHGIPETPDGYALTKPEGIPDAAWDQEGANEFQKWAHEKGLAPDLVKDLAAFDVQRQQRVASNMQQQQAQQAEQLRLSEAQELGKRFGDKLDGTLKDVQAIAQSMGKDPKIFDPASDQFWGVEALQFATDLLKRVPRGEDGTVRNVGAPSQNGAYNKEWAKAAIVKGHPDYEALTNASHPRHAEMTQRRNEAYALG